jgi:hypothetical protein
LAGAFVHLEKQRPGPAAALFKLALNNFTNYPETYYRLNLKNLARQIEEWWKAAEESISGGVKIPPPRLRLEE